MSRHPTNLAINSQEDFLLPFYLGTFVLASLLMRYVYDPAKRNLLCFLFGFLSLVTAASFQFILQQLALAALNYLILKFTLKSWCHVLTFFTSFSYLLYMRIYYLYNEDSYNSIADCAVLFIVFRYVSVAFDTYQSNLPADKQKKYLHRTVGSEEIINIAIRNPIKLKFITYIGYIFSFNGLYTGPFYRYITYTDCLTLYQNNNDLKSTVNCKNGIGKYLPPFLDIFKTNSISFIICLAIYHVLNAILPSVENIEDSLKNYQNKPLHMIIYMLLLFIRFRIRLIGAFIFADLSFKIMGIGAYPSNMNCLSGHGPTKMFNSEQSEDLKIDFATIKNFDYHDIELGTRMKLIVRRWNICVQWWLAAYVYQVFPFKSIRTHVVFLVSSFWHGVKAGYYLCIFEASIYLTVESFVDKYVGSHIKSRSTNSKFFRFLLILYDAYMRFMAYRSFEYFGISVLITSWSGSLVAWKIVAYYIHWYMGIWLVIGYIIMPFFSFVSKSKNKTH